MDLRTDGPRGVALDIVGSRYIIILIFSHNIDIDIDVYILKLYFPPVVNRKVVAVVTIRF
jgi:hypothetical protein